MPDVRRPGVWHRDLRAEAGPVLRTAPEETTTTPELSFARQPILDAAGVLAGYELLSYGGSSPLGAVTGVALRDAAAGVPAYLTADPDVLLAVDPLPFGPEGVVLQVAGGDLHPEALERLRTLARDGYHLVAEGPLDRTPAELLALVRGVKLPPEAAGQLAEVRAAGLQAIACEVASPEQHEECAAAGFDLFQGDFICRPRRLRAAAVSSASLSRLRSAAAVTSGQDVDDLERAIGMDPALSLRLLRFVNSAAFSLRSRVTSVRHAVALLGPRTVKQWAALVVLAGDQSPSGPKPVAVTGLARARTCEAIARRLGMDDPDAYFLVGLLSVADALLDAPMDALLAELPLADDLIAALTQRAGGKGRALLLAEACERGAWGEVELPGLDPELLAHLHAAALRWADAAAAGLA